MIRPLRPRLARSSGRAPRWRGSWRALLIALGLILAQGPMLLHLLIVRHVTCEHGELVEAAHGTSVSGGRRDVVIEAAEQPAAEPGDRAESEHEHCDALGARHRPTDAQLAVQAASLVDIDPPPALSPGRESRPVSILALAPKGSPPAA